MVAQALNLAAAPLLTRLYGPGAWGTYGLFAMVLAIYQVAGALRLEMAIVSSPDRESADTGTWTSLLVVLATAAIVGAGIQGLRSLGLTGAIDLGVWTAPLFFGALLATGIASVARYWFVRQEGFGVVATAVVVQNAGRAGVQLVSSAFAAVGLVAGEIVGRAAAGFLLLRHWSRAATLRPPPWRDIKSFVTHNRTFPLVGFPSALIDSLALNLPVALVAGSFGLAAAGQFTLVQRVLAVPLVLVGGSVADAFHAHLADLARSESGKELRVFLTTAAGLLAVGIVPALALALAGAPLFRFVFGEAWTTAGLFAAAMAPWFLTKLVVSPLTRTVFVFNRQATKLAYDIFVLAGTVAAFELAVPIWGLSATHAVLLLSLLNATAYLALFTLLVFAIRNRPSSPDTLS